ncbi:uncharacterized protein BJ171DRAFT_113144 [Polychytrium aggregatum]|uniref:uncharacterized protein n=1 Tax=Polychytrium aggregatum TaxID=110093 RepID=UPI0022FE8EEA|nr:uncharacterized protein BJ171DRAFT_113144 [Polychytrium aggregatum]KAI9209314.1 hypothetical protein BJ171DRAFT_113144 [Polychytrium aggregatum]
MSRLHRQTDQQNLLVGMSSNKTIPPYVQDEPGSVFLAIYSGIKVYELLKDCIPVMRRCVDDFINATQVLKAAGLNKCQRNTVIQKEVQKQIVHDKVQGGYNKFQGTWIPLDVARKLSQKYNVYEDLKPLFDFDPSVQKATRRPPGTAHHVAATAFLAAMSAPKTPLEMHHDPRMQIKSYGTKVKDRPSKTGYEFVAPLAAEFPIPVEFYPFWIPMVRGNPSRASPTPSSPIASPTLLTLPEPQDAIGGMCTYSPVSPEPCLTEVRPSALNALQKEILSSIFLEEPATKIIKLLQLSTLPSSIAHAVDLVKRPDTDVAVDMVLDHSGNTALHWAAALGRQSIVAALVECGANVALKNENGQTPLLKATSMESCYEAQAFGGVLYWLSDSLWVKDDEGNTVVHYVVRDSLQPRRRAVGAYYLTMLYEYFRERDQAQAQWSLFNEKNHRQESPLHVAVQSGHIKIIKMLLAMRANRESLDADGRLPEDHAHLRTCASGIFKVFSEDEDWEQWSWALWSNGSSLCDQFDHDPFQEEEEDQLQNAALFEPRPRITDRESESDNTSDQVAPHEAEATVDDEMEYAEPAACISCAGVGEGRSLASRGLETLCWAAGLAGVSDAIDREQADRCTLENNTRSLPASFYSLLEAVKASDSPSPASSIDQLATVALQHAGGLAFAASAQPA